MSKEDLADSESQEQGGGVAVLEPDGEETNKADLEGKVTDEENTDAKEKGESESEDEPEFLDVTLDGESLPMDEDEEIDDDDLEESDDPLINKIRKVNRKKNDQIKEQRKEIDDLKKVVDELRVVRDEGQELSATKTVSMPERPRFEDYDTDEEFEKAQDAYFEKKVEHDRQKAEGEALAEKQKKSWEESLKVYQEGQKRFKVDFREIEKKALEHTNQEQLGIVVHGAKDPSLIISAFAKDPKAKDLTAIKDPVKFAIGLGAYQERVGSSRKNGKRKPPPEKTPKGGAPAGSMDSQLATLEAEAAKTGNRTKLIQYKRKKNLL